MTSTERSRRLPGRARSKFCERPAFDAHVPTWEGAFHAEQLRRGDETKSSGAGTPLRTIRASGPEQIGRAVTRSTAMVSWSGSWPRWIDWRSARSAPGTSLRTSASRSPICAAPGSVCARSPVDSNERRRRSRANCGATRWPDTGIGPSMLHRRATVRRARRHRRRVDVNRELGGVVAELLLRRWSPQQISRHLRHRYPDDPSMWLCHDSIYQAVYQPNSRFLRPSPLAPHRRSPLRTGRDHRRAHQRQQRRRPRFQQPMLTIHDRPFPVDDRSEAGHWEGDSIIGNNHL
jgi:hypothetical protein